LRIFKKITLLILLLLSSLNAKVGVCEVQPEDKKELFLECLVKEAERTDEIADINMVANAYSHYVMQKKVVEWYAKSIKKNDAKAMYKTAGYYANILIKTKKINNGYYEGIMLKYMKKGLANSPQKLNQPKKAIELYKQAALKNYKDAIAKLSEVMEVVYGKEGAIKQYEKEMAEGDKNTYRFLANLYVRYGQYDKALNLYEKQLKQDEKNAEIYALIGSLHETYYKDKDKAKTYYEKAATLGNAISMYNLGIMAGDDGEYEKAEEYFRASEKAGRKNTLGMICYMNYSQENDYKRAEECNLILAKKGDAEDMFEMGIFFLKRVHKYNKAIYWLTKSYEAGNSSSAIALGYYYYKGKGNNKEKAIYWYKKAAGMGEPGGWSYLYEQEVF